MSIRLSNGEFQNLDGPVEQVISSYVRALVKLYFNRERKPHHPIEVDYPPKGQQYQLQDEQFVWFGHSSILIKTKGKTFLFDPVMFSHLSFQYTMELTPDQIPEIDYYLLTHNHADHLSTQQLEMLKDKIHCAIVPLANKSYVENALNPGTPIYEMDWFETKQLTDDILLQFVPSRHYSQTDVNDKYKSLWGGYMINDIYISGDSSFSRPMFEQIYEKAVNKPKYCFIECGQFSVSWLNNHMLPQQSKEAYEILHGQCYIPIHFGRFALSTHAWNITPKLCEKHMDHCFVGVIGRVYNFKDCIGVKYIDKCWDE